MLLTTSLLVVFFIPHARAFGPLSKLSSLLKSPDAASPRVDFDVQRITQQSCASFTLSDVSQVLEYYPKVQVTCVSEGSVLVPKALWDYDSQIGGNATCVEQPTVPGDFQFVEIKSRSVSNSTRYRFPIAACVRPGSEGGSGQFEVAISLGTVLRLTGEIRGTLGYFLDSGSLSRTSSSDTEFAHSLVCSYSDKAVRPMVEASAVEVLEQTRSWGISSGKTLKLETGPWTAKSRARLQENSLMLACVSERHEPDICHAYKSKALGRLDQYIISSPEEK